MRPYTVNAQNSSYKTYKIGPFKTSNVEIRDLFKAWVAISVAFAVVIGRQYLFSPLFLYNVFVSAVTVGLGFLLHELGHKMIAQRFRLFSEFRSFDNMLILALVMSFLGFVFAAPGAVMISGHVDAKRNGKISTAGPLVNIILALAFFVAGYLFHSESIIFTYGFMINSWLALFNLIPIGNFDGVKIFNWNKTVYASMVIMAFGLLVLQL